MQVKHHASSGDVLVVACCSEWRVVKTAYDEAASEP